MRTEPQPSIEATLKNAGGYPKAAPASSRPSFAGQPAPTQPLLTGWHREPEFMGTKNWRLGSNASAGEANHVEHGLGRRRQEPDPGPDGPVALGQVPLDGGGRPGRVVDP